MFFFFLDLEVAFPARISYLKYNSKMLWDLRNKLEVWKISSWAFWAIDFGMEGQISEHNSGVPVSDFHILNSNGN